MDSNVCQTLQIGGRLTISEETMQTMSALRGVDRNQTIHELAIKAGLTHTTVLLILKQRWEFEKLCESGFLTFLWKYRNGYDTTQHEHGMTAEGRFPTALHYAG